MKERADGQLFVKKLSKLDHSKNNAEKFRDFCEMAYCSLARLTAEKERGEALESRYLEIVASYAYPDKDSVQTYPKLLAMVFDGICSGQDVLGVAAVEVGALASDQSQFFTPFCLCRMMAEMTLADAKFRVAEQGYITMNDPAVGSGATMIAAADELHRQGINPERQMLVYVTDISLLCYHMAFVQLSLKGIPAYVEHGNSLTRERFDGAWTVGALLFHCRHGHLFPEDEGPDAEETDPPQCPPEVDLEQLNLF